MKRALTILLTNCVNKNRLKLDSNDISLSDSTAAHTPEEGMEIEDSCSGSGSGVNSSDINMANSKELFLRGAVGGGGGGGVPKIDENNAMADDGSSNVKR